MMYYTDDPNRDFDRWDADQQAKLDRLPKCYACGEPITDLYMLSWNGHHYHPYECHEAWHEEVYKACKEPTR